MSKQILYCCGCKGLVHPRLTNGKEIYPHRKNLAALPFWRCDACKNFVGCHHKSKTPTKPLGCIPTPDLKKARREIHAILDPLWRDEVMERKDIYKRLSEDLGKEYHTGHIRTVEEAEQVCELLESYRIETGQ